MKIKSGLWWITFFQLLSVSGIAQTQTSSGSSEFRIKIDIYDNESKPPINSIETIFMGGQYIELDDNRGRVTVVDPGKGRVSILNSETRTMVHLEMAVLEKQVNSILSEMTTEQRRKFSSTGEPTADSAGFVSLGNANFSYKFKTFTPSDPNIAISYGDFANWSARVNARYYKVPPIMRMELNQLLMDQRQLPEELHRLTVIVPANQADPVGKTEEIIARLFLTEPLTNNDRSRMAGVLKSMTEFKINSEKEFFSTDAQLRATTEKDSRSKPRS